MNKRNSNIELVRIISMIFIIMSHYTVHNGISNSILPLGFNRFYLEITTLGNIGVILFILISGYFLIDSDQFKLKKFLKIVFQVAFYSILIYLIFNFCGLTSFSLKEFIKNILPITFDQYWFATCYIVLYIFHPFINKILTKLTKREYELYLIISLILFSIIPSLIPVGIAFYGNELVQFILFYSIGGYLKKYKITWLTRVKNNIILIISTLILILSVIGIDYLSIKLPGLSNLTTHFLDRNSIVSILFSVSLFNCFLTITPFTSKAVNLLASATFGVYLIHDNNYMRSIIWTKFFPSSHYISSNYLILHAIISVIIVFIICVIVELIRQNLIEKPLFKIIGSKIDATQEKISKKIALKD